MDSSCKHIDAVSDIHSGDKICISCGMVLMQSILFEIEKPNEYSKTSADNHEYGENMDHITLTNYKNDKTLYRNIGSKVRNVDNSKVIHQWYAMISDCSFDISDRVIDTVKQVLRELIKTGEYRHIAGTNRRGLVAACIQHSCVLYEENCPQEGLYGSFNIKSTHFFHGRRFLYEWNQTYHVCDWFLRPSNDSR